MRPRQVPQEYRPLRSALVHLHFNLAIPHTPAPTSHPLPRLLLLQVQPNHHPQNPPPSQAYKKHLHHHALSHAAQHLCLHLSLQPVRVHQALLRILRQDLVHHARSPHPRQSWASRGRILEREVGYSGLPSIMISLYVFLINYFYMNILIGSILESLQSENVAEQKKANYQSFLESCMYGTHYQCMVMALAFLGVISNLSFHENESLLEVYLQRSISLCYTVHLCLLLFLKGPRYLYERQRWERLAIHILAGPLGCVSDHQMGSFFNLLKLATTPIVRGVFSGTIRIFGILLPGLSLLLAIVLLMSAIASSQYYMFYGFKGEHYFSSLQKALYTFIQILTLDDWNANVLPVFEKFSITLPYILFPLFIVISNFVLLNILIALSGKYFAEVDYSIMEMSTRFPSPQNNLRKLTHEIRAPKVFLFAGPNTREEQAVAKAEGFIELQYRDKKIACLIV